MQAKPLPYQKEGVRRMERFLATGGGALLADDMGLGKTLQALWLMCRGKNGPMWPALVVCPASVKYNWEHEAITHVGIRSQVLEGRTPPPFDPDPTLLPKIYIINPDILRHWVPYIRLLGIKTLVLDESQYFTNLTSQRTEAAISLARSVPYRIALSGTPLTNRPGELWPTLHMLRPDAFPSFFSYAQTFCAPKRLPWGWDYGGAENIPQLHKLLTNTCMVRRLKKDVLHDLPSKVRRVVALDIGSKGLKEYRHASTEFLTWLKEAHGSTRAAKAAKAAAVARVGYLLRLSAKLKCRAVIEWINAFLAEYPQEKLVVYAIHQKMIKVLQKHIKADHVTVDGGVAGRRRKLAVDTFKRDKSCRVFIGNIRAAGTGINGLQDVCSNMAFAEMWWRPGDLIQAEDRLHRIGQGRVAWINYLVAGDTAEEKLCKIIQTKQGIIRATLDGEAVPGDMDIFDQLLKEIGL